MPPVNDDATSSEKFYPIFELLGTCDDYYAQNNEVIVDEVLNVMMIAINEDVRVPNMSSQLVRTALKMHVIKALRR